MFSEQRAGMVAQHPRGVRVEAWIVLIVAVLAFLFAAVWESYRCGDSCGSRASFQPWWYEEDAWQWVGQLVLAGLGVAFSAASLLLLARAPRAGLAALWAAVGTETFWLLVIFGVIE